MKHLILFALLLGSLGAAAQTVTTPPAGSKGYGSPVATPSGEILVGRNGSYTYITRKAYTDSAIASKISDIPYVNTIGDQFGLAGTKEWSGYHRFANGNIGIGNSSIRSRTVSGIPLTYIGSSTTSPNSFFFTGDSITLGASVNIKSISDYMVAAQSVAGNSYTSFDARPRITGSGNWSTLIGTYIRPLYEGTGSLATYEGLSVELSHTGGAINNAYMARLKAPSGAGSVSNLYGLYVENINSGTNNYAIYTNAGKVRIGDSLTVNSGIRTAGSVISPSLTLNGQTISSRPSPTGISGYDTYIGSQDAAQSRFYTGGTLTLNNNGGHGISDYLTVNQSGAGPASAYASFDARTNMTGAGAYDHYVGFQSRIAFSGSGPINNYMEGLRTILSNNGTGTVNNMIGLHVMGKQGPGPVNNHYGILMQPISGGSNNYAIYTNSGIVRFGDSLLVNSAIRSSNHIISGGHVFSGGNFYPQNASGSGVSFLSNDANKVYVSSASNPSSGGRIGETTSDFNMYFRMSSATNRGFVFQAGATPVSVAGIDYVGNARFAGSVSGNGAYINTSDSTIKNIISHDWSSAASLEARAFTYKDNRDGGRVHVGYIAQEVKEVLPGAVYEAEDTGLLSVDHVQVLIAKIDRMEAKIKELESRIEQLEQ